MSRASQPRSLGRALRAAAVPLLLLVAGCPVPPIRSGATLKPSQLPNDLPSLLRAGDELYARENATDGENALLAFDKAHAIAPQSYEAAWKAARVCSWLATTLFEDKTRRAHFSGRGIEYAKSASQLEPNRVEGYYYSGINLGISASSKTIGAYNMVPRVRDALKRAIQIDASFDHGGPLRVLGTVYIKAPPWPASIGDVEQGIEYLVRATQLAPEYPQNNLFLGDAYVADSEWGKAREQYQIVLAAPTRQEWGRSLETWKQAAKKGLIDILKRERQQADSSSF